MNFFSVTSPLKLCQDAQGKALSGYLGFIEFYMNVPRSNFATSANYKTSEPFEWTERPGEKLISDTEWTAVKQYSRLSTREGQVCRLLFEGNKRDQIAETLGISPRTVRYHLESLHKKLHVNARVGLVLRMVQLRDFLVSKNSFASARPANQLVSPARFGGFQD
ncbi:helix-turn-helix transcriptional regulator [Mariniblastus fucicola]|uniref:Transcriptional regulator MalT n=1 Tax=Mariniblastus fucicola TaxID=980251 RepID=A0A5B9PIY0_9BACT|nr:helix-turn-helix transcriptional regulator [Mariniblastus fucicola]QEG25200.1 transcriptional regulator MalT [Mariniblastus fucicola]